MAKYISAGYGYVETSHFLMSQLYVSLGLNFQLYLVTPLHLWSG